MKKSVFIACFFCFPLYGDGTDRDNTNDLINIHYVEKIAGESLAADFPDMKVPDYLAFELLVEMEGELRLALSFNVNSGSSDPDYVKEAREYRETYKEYVRKHYQRPEVVNGIFQSVPHPKTLQPAPEKESVHVKALISGGDLRPYSFAVAKNQASFAKVRGMSYDFVVFEASEDNPLGSWVTQNLVNVKPYWGKVLLLQKWLAEQRIPENKWVAWIDDDIVINDLSKVQSRLDWVVEYVPEDTCIITMLDYWGLYRALGGTLPGDKVLGGSRRANTGIVLLQNQPSCLPVVEKWLSFSQDARMAMGKQDITLHEQEALERLGEIYRIQKERAEFYLDFDMEFDSIRQKPEEYPETKADEFDKHRAYIVLLQNRNHKQYEFKRGAVLYDRNINTFKRHDFVLDGRVSGFDRDFEFELAALPDDSYVHHSGMPTLFRTLLISHTLKEVRY